MKTLTLPITEIESNPWNFRLMPERDLEILTSTIRENGVTVIPQPIIAKIDKKYYLVDGHARISAAEACKIKEISCSFADWIRTYHDLRVWSFRLNRQGYSNLLILSDMVNEDLALLHNMENVAAAYGVNQEYVSSLVKLKSLHDDTKAIIQKIMNVARKKYQFLLEQLTPAHLASLAELPPQKQVEVVDWIFHDIMYGPTDESLVSIPSIYEIINEISRVSDEKSKKVYKKSQKTAASREPFVCRCGSKYDIDAKSHTVYEFVEKDNVILKKEVKSFESASVFSSENHTKNQLHKIIDDFYSEFEIKVLLAKRDSYENWQ
ncbi:MAG: ParB/RepB/Spo0J family partition protein [Nitrososphaerota archaeon]